MPFSPNPQRISWTTEQEALPMPAMWSAEWWRDVLAGVFRLWRTRQDGLNLRAARVEQALAQALQFQQQPVPPPVIVEVVAQALQFQQQPVPPSAIRDDVWKDLPWPLVSPSPAVPSEWRELQMIRRGKSAAKRQAARLEREGRVSVRPAVARQPAAQPTIVGPEKEPEPVAAIRQNRRRKKGGKKKNVPAWKHDLYFAFVRKSAERDPDPLTADEKIKLCTSHVPPRTLRRRSKESLEARTKRMTGLRRNLFRTCEIRLKRDLNTSKMTLKEYALFLLAPLPTATN